MQTGESSEQQAPLLFLQGGTENGRTAEVFHRHEIRFSLH